MDPTLSLTEGDVGVVVVEAATASSRTLRIRRNDAKKCFQVSIHQILFQRKKLLLRKLLCRMQNEPICHDFNVMTAATRDENMRRLATYEAQTQLCRKFYLPLGMELFS